MKSRYLSALFLSLALTGAPALESKPYSLSGCTESTLTSSTGASYRIMVSIPPGEAPPGGHAIAYVLDGDDLFPLLTSILKVQGGTAKLSQHNAIVPGIIVGIGYGETSRRDYDYTPPAPAGPPETYRNGKPYPPREGGGADKLLDFIEKELKPEIEKQYRVDRTRQALIGNGYGGLFALHVLFTRPQSFQTYVASSPSVWWNDRYILQEEAAFTKRVASNPVKARLILGVGELEQSLTQIEYGWAEDEREEHRLKVTRRKMVDNTRELYWRLRAIPGLESSLRVFEGESHKSVIPISMNHALPLVFQREPQP